MNICKDFICKYDVDDMCNDNVQCGDCLYHDCDNCVYHTQVSEFEEYCTIQDGCGCGQTFSP